MTTAKADAGTAGKTAGERVPSQSGAGRETVLATGHGKTTIADVVVQKIAGLAAREISGVHKLGGGVARAFGVVMERIPGATPSVGQGVSVEVGERQAAVDLDLVVEYGAEIGELTQAIRRNVIGSIERMTGLEVTEVNISVDDVHLPGDDGDGDGDGEARVE
ncbi:MAG TPA: Asp23/Gls24 family envelope stress response protein [Streptosporangiaceae bacterium]|nr:Asp23/Gls24 family envelope stress response protein [Streptosporangiaceae bacterium]